MRRLLAGSFVLLALAGCGAATLPAVHSESERLSVARRLHDKGNCTEASELLKTYIANSAGTADVDDAIYLLGDCYLKTKDWALAQGEFERLVRDYPESDSSGSAAFRLGEALQGQSRPRDFDQEFTMRAIDQWHTYLRDYPGHWLNPEAQRRLMESRTRMANKLADTGDLYLRQRLYQPARVYFEQLIDEYGDTPVRPRAELGVAICDAKQGRRDQALERLRRIESQYPGSMAERAARERKRIERS
jgi:outer membrane protein assembly factor BamD